MVDTCRYRLLFSSCLDAIPSFTLEGGFSGSEAYVRALKNGGAHDKRVKVVLIGQDGAAKTELSQLLRGKCLYNGGRRTSGIQIDFSEKPWKFSSRKSSENEGKHAKTTGRDYPYESKETANGEPSEAFDEIDGMASSPVPYESEETANVEPSEAFDEVDGMTRSPVQGIVLG